MFKKLNSSEKKNKVPPCLLITAGYAGSGKTTLAKKLARDLDFLLIDKDTVTRPFTDLILTKNGTGPHDRESEFYMSEIRDLEYRICYDICKENLRLNHSVILSAPSIKEVQDYNTFSDVFEASFFETLGIKLKVIWMKHDIDLEKHRVIARGAVRDRNKIENWE